MSSWEQMSQRTTDPAILGLSETPTGGKQDWLEGCFVRVETAAGEVIEKGQVYTFDEATKVLVLRLPNTSNVTNPSVFDYRLIKQRFIKTISITGDKGPAIPPVSYVNIASLKARERKAVKAADQALARIGTDVTAHAQQVFDALAKTLDPEWRGKHILCRSLDVTLKPPYDTNSLHGDDKAKTHVKRVLEGELKKLGM